MTDYDHFFWWGLGTKLVLLGAYESEHIKLTLGSSGALPYG